MTTQILKLRQAEASVSKSNADFNISLDRPINMKEGDTLNIKSVYLDTITASGQMIELSDDVNIECDVAKYIINDSADQVFPNPNHAVRMKNYSPTPGGTVTTDGDGGVYFACKHTATPAGMARLEFE